MDELRDALAEKLETQKLRLDRINNHRRRILSIDNHWREEEDRARNIVSHGQSLLWAIDNGGNITDDNRTSA
jgi:ParB-like chromosome segregation protein Spo0J